MKLDKDPESTARTRSTILMFKVRWAPPYSDPSEDNCEPRRNVHILHAFRDFMASPAWQRFAASDQYKHWSSLSADKRKLPVFVTFVLSVCGRNGSQTRVPRQKAARRTNAGTKEVRLSSA